MNAQEVIVKVRCCGREEQTRECEEPQDQPNGQCDEQLNNLHGAQHLVRERIRPRWREVVGTHTVRNEMEEENQKLKVSDLSGDYFFNEEQLKATLYC